MTITPGKNAKDRFWLRPLSNEHIPVIARWHERIDDLKLFDRRMPLPISSAAMEADWKSSIFSTEPRTSHWFVVVDSDDAVKGLAGLQEINYVHGDAVIAILVAESGRRNGIGIRASALLLDMAFYQLRLTRVSSFVRADNEGSNRMTARLGFLEEGCIRKGWFTDGTHVDIRVIGLLQDEWDARRETLQSELSPNTCLTLGDGPTDRWSWPKI
jgi:RimJ/RimL family protein N-acetyltransferase